MIFGFEIKQKLTKTKINQVKRPKQHKPSVLLLNTPKGLHKEFSKLESSS